MACEPATGRPGRPALAAGTARRLAVGVTGPTASLPHTQRDAGPETVTIVGGGTDVRGSATGASLPELFSVGYPRSFTFRQSEAMVNTMSYSLWEPFMLLQNGIMGKVTQEERTDTVTALNAQSFDAYKRNHPQELVMWHLNGRGQRPESAAAGFSAGHWLYRAGTRLTAAVSPRATVLPVQATSMFNLNTGRYQDRGDDVVLVPRNVEGALVWSNAEQAVLTGIDGVAGTITVRRGQYGTAARSFAAGAYVAPHAVGGPWCSACSFVWYWNLSTACPRGSSRRTAADVLVSSIVARLGAAGELALLDGVELDVFDFDSPGGSTSDVDVDAVADGGVVAGVNVYGRGQVDFLRRLRAALPAKLI